MRAPQGPDLRPLPSPAASQPLRHLLVGGDGQQPAGSGGPQAQPEGHLLKPGPSPGLPRWCPGLENALINSLRKKVLDTLLKHFYGRRAACSFCGVPTRRSFPSVSSGRSAVCVHTPGQRPPSPPAHPAPGAAPPHAATDASGQMPQWPCPSPPPLWATPALGTGRGRGGRLAASEDGASCRPSLPLFVLFAREDDPQPLLPTSGTGPLSLTPCSSRDQSVTLAPFPPLRLWGQMKPPWEMAQGCLLRPAPSQPSRGALYTCCQGAWEQPAWTPMA